MSHDASEICMCPDGDKKKICHQVDPKYCGITVRSLVVAEML